MSAYRTHYEPAPLDQVALDRRARRRSRVMLAIVLVAVLGPLLLAAVIKLASAAPPVRVITIDRACGHGDVVDTL